jgi:hypothetical protein
MVTPLTLIIGITSIIALVVLSYLVFLAVKPKGGGIMAVAKKKVAMRFSIDLKQNSRKQWYIVLKSRNGRTFNHQYNTRAKAVQSAKSLQKSFKQGHLRQDYED